MAKPHSDMSEIIYTREKMVRIKSLDDLRGHNGKAVIRTPYYRLLSDGNLLCEFIWNDTDPKLLQAQIDEGVLYKSVEIISIGP